MPAKNDTLANQLLRDREITITVTGRKSGRHISNPVWFVSEGEKLYLLPVKGSDTQWYKNVISNSRMRIKAGASRGDFHAVPITDTRQVSSIVEKFRNKYGPGDVKKYYSKLDVAVVAQVR